jgi:hypothetical protein
LSDLARCDELEGKDNGGKSRSDKAAGLEVGRLDPTKTSPCAADKGKKYTFASKHNTQAKNQRKALLVLFPLIKRHSPTHH